MTKARKAANPQKRAVSGCLPSAKTRCAEHSSVKGMKISLSEAASGVWAGITVFYTRAIENKIMSGLFKHILVQSQTCMTPESSEKIVPLDIRETIQMQKVLQNKIKINGK